MVDGKSAVCRFAGVPRICSRARVVGAPVLARILGRRGISIGAARSKDRSNPQLDEGWAVASCGCETRRIVAAQSGKYAELHAAADDLRKRDQRVSQSFTKLRAGIRRLLLLTSDRQTKHVVAEVLVDGRWIVVDPSFRVVMRDRRGRALTRKDLQNPAKFREATSLVPNYPADYNYDRYAHVRLARLPLDGFHLRKLLESILPGWDETLDWSLFLERESFFVLVITAAFALISLALRLLLAWYADRRLRVPRFHFRQHFLRATSAFLTTPEIE